MKCELIFYLAGRTGQLEELLEELLGAWRAWRQPDGTPEKIRQALRRQGARRERAVEAFLA